MIRVYKNNDIKYVTKGAYESFYRPLGYNIIIESPVAKPEVEKESTIQLDEVKETPKRTRVSSKKINKEKINDYIMKREDNSTSNGFYK